MLRFISTPHVAGDVGVFKTMVLSYDNNLTLAEGNVF